MGRFLFRFFLSIYIYFLVGVQWFDGWYFLERRYLGSGYIRSNTMVMFLVEDTWAPFRLSSAWSRLDQTSDLNSIIISYMCTPRYIDQVHQLAVGISRECTDRLMEKRLSLGTMAQAHVQYG